jgi:membrane associated rhomboid family serine protease
MVSKLIIINVAVFMLVLFLKIILNGANPGSEGYVMLIKNLAISSEGLDALFKPWTLITHMFLHEGFWHLIWNMLLLFWFGRIVGDFVGDNRILPLYIMGGLFGIVFFLLFAKIGLLHSGLALGASAAVMAIIASSAFISPDYNMRLLIIGNVPLKYVVLFLIVWDFVGIGAMDNTGGHIAHLGGVIYGGIYVYLLRQGNDLADGFNNMIDGFKNVFSREQKPAAKKSPLTVTHKAKTTLGKAKGNKATDQSMPYQEQLDKILEKIKEQGYDNLSEEEKEFLFQASKR